MGTPAKLQAEMNVQVGWVVTDAQVGSQGGLHGGAMATAAHGALLCHARRGTLDELGTCCQLASHGCRNGISITDGSSLDD